MVPGAGVLARSRPSPVDGEEGEAKGEGRRGPSTGILVAVLLLVFLGSPVHAVSDSVWVVHTARSLVARQDVDLDEFRPMVDRSGGFQLDTIDGRSYYSVPLATSLAAVPAVAVASLVTGGRLDADLGHEGGGRLYDALTAALLVALTALVVRAITRRVTGDDVVAKLAMVIFALGTPAWATASATVWMHTPSMLALALALYCALRARDSAHWSVFLGASLAWAFFVRPTNAVLVVCFGLYAVHLGWRCARGVAIGGLAVSSMMVGLDLLLYGRLLQPYFQANRLELSWTTIEALAGNLVSPSRGLVFYVPLVAVGGAVVVSKVRRRTFTALDGAVLGGMVGTWFVVSCFPQWWGGVSYGPRFLTDLAPYFIWFVIPALARLSSVSRGVVARPRWVFAAVLLIGASVFVQARGAIDQGTIDWHTSPLDVDFHTDRIWDWSDPQILR